MTSLESEQKAQNQWKTIQGGSQKKFWDRLLTNEFLNQDSRNRVIDQRLKLTISHAVSNSEYYKTLFRRFRIHAKQIKSIEDLQYLPILNKETLIAKEHDLTTKNLPLSARGTSYCYSSGTSGRRARVMITHHYHAMNTFLMARNYRWFRMNPFSLFAAIREPRFFTHQLDKSPPLVKKGTQKNWHGLGGVFRTGPAIYMSSTSPFDEQQAWLNLNQPSYIQAYPSILEEHAFASPEGLCGNSLQSIMAVSAQLTKPMRNRIENSFGVPVNQNYGLNEVGIVAGRCNSGRYHVHTEQCIVEIVDNQGKQCKPGQSGKIVVTSLNNPAMPLIRYDTGDMATVSNNLCPCGRTLPSFENISGRYHRWLNVPSGTREKFMQLTAAFEALSSEQLKNVHGYQVHLNIDDSLILRIQSTTELPSGIHTTILKVWAALYPEEAYKLSVQRVEKLDVPMNGKIQQFTTDYDESPKPS